MVQPRFIFVCSQTAQGQAATANAAQYGHVVWRLLGANNRELGRSPLWYGDLDSCREAVRLLKREIDTVTSAITAVALPGGAWSWRLAANGRPIAIAGRPYHRQRECAYNLDHFVAAVPMARISDEFSVTARR
jgi:hypothetical protein